MNVQSSRFSDGFLQSAMKTLFRLSRVYCTFRSIEMPSKRRKKIFIFSVILGELSPFEITRASVLFFENFRCNLTFYERENFSDSSLHGILESENFRFPFSKKNSVT